MSRIADQRESGYAGWIDQDGYPADGPTFARREASADPADTEVFRLGEQPPPGAIAPTVLDPPRWAASA